MPRSLRLLAGFVFSFVLSSAAAEPDWGRDVAVPPEGRANPYDLPAEEFAAANRAGRGHALQYPVNVTGILLPLDAARRFLEERGPDPLRDLLRTVTRGLNRVRSLDDLQAWLGLHRFPTAEGAGPYLVPFNGSQTPTDRMGFTIIETDQGRGFTISCAQCHSAELFGRRVIGLTNRFPRANAFFAHGLKAAPLVSPSLFQWSTQATAGETRLFARSRKAMAYVGAKAPVQLGLDTSLAQVALSLARREQDPWASRERPIRPRPEVLRKTVADSKPAVWWNVKYKNRWLSDGSVVAGNPILTNLLWNELGRGTDLRKLDDWLSGNQETLKELTTAVFASSAPRWTDFFPAETFDIGAAQRGEKSFNMHCARCHGVYEKNWSRPDAESLSRSELLETWRVSYQPRKPVYDVGTDPLRWQGMTSLAQMNDLEISKRNGIVIEPQQGYVPPPLVGIWARWPYFHNNAVPNLCAVLTRGTDRPERYWAREARDPVQDFDADCNGYPMKRRPPGATADRLYVTERDGMSRFGHDERIFLEQGREKMTAAEKRDLIRYLQTL